MATSLDDRVAALIAKAGRRFDSEDKAKLDEMLLLHPNLDESHQAEEAAHEALWLIIANPLYQGDLKPSDLGR